VATIAFVGSVEMVIGMIRHTRLQVVPEPVTGLVALPVSGERAAREALRMSVRRGRPLSIRELSREFGLTHYAATVVRQEVLGEGGGTGPDDAG
jgi:hypothetical protein